MKLIKAKTKDGQEVEIELPEGYGLISEMQEANQTRFESEFARRAKGLTKTARAEAMEDEAFRTEALSKWGIDVDALKRAAETQGGTKEEQAKYVRDQVDRARSEWERTVLGPKMKELETLSGKLGTLHDRLIAGEIVQAAQGAGVHKHLLRSVEGSEPAVVGMFRNRFGYDEETGKWYAKQGDRFKVSAKPTDEQTYMGVAEYLETLSTNQQYSDLFEDRRQKGAGVRETGGGGERAVGVLQKNDAVAFGLNAEKIAKGEVTLAS